MAPKNYFCDNGKKNQKGISIYLSLLIMSILLGLGLGISTLLLGQLKIIGDIENSTIAFFAADTGVEEVLYGQQEGITSGVLSNGAAYQAVLSFPGSDPDCDAENYCIKSVGIFKETRRAVEIKR